MRSVLVDVAVALLILMLTSAVLGQIANVEEGETAPAWVGILPLILAMIWLFWRTTRRRRARAEEEAGNATAPVDDPPEMTDREGRWGDPSDFGDERDAAPAAAMSEALWRSRLESAVRNLGRDAFERYALRIVAALELTDVRVERIAFDGAIECIGRESGADGANVYVICRRSFGSLGANQIRDLRQQMEGKADEALFISNGEFSTSAVNEAERGDAPIELIDGGELIDLMHEHAIGLLVDERGDVIDIDEAWFQSLNEHGDEAGV